MCIIFVICIFPFTFFNVIFLLYLYLVPFYFFFNVIYFLIFLEEIKSPLFLNTLISFQYVPFSINSLLVFYFVQMSTLLFFFFLFYLIFLFNTFRVRNEINETFSFITSFYDFFVFRIKLSFEFKLSKETVGRVRAVLV